MKHIKLFLVLFLLSGCSALINGITGNFSRFDSHEYYQVVEIEIDVAETKAFCDRPAQIKEELRKIERRLKALRLYASGRPYNDPTLRQIDLLKNEVAKAEVEFSHPHFSKKFCFESMQNLEEMSDILRKSTGEKKQ